MSTPENEARSEATAFRVKYGLGGEQPIGDLVTVIEQATGFDVAIVDAGPDSDQHGMTMRDPILGAVYIAVAKTRNPMRQRSTLAHELAHVLFEDGAVADAGWSDRPPSEIRADAFARHLLVPREGIVGLLGSRTAVEKDLSDVVQRFLVSPALAAIALFQAGRIMEDTKLRWATITTRMLAARYGWIDQYSALQDESDHRRAPQRLLTRAIKGYEEGILSAQAIGTLRGLDARSVELELREAGISPDEVSIAWTDATDLPPVDDDLSDLEEIHQDAKV